MKNSEVFLVAVSRPPITKCQQSRSMRTWNLWILGPPGGLLAADLTLTRVLLLNRFRSRSPLTGRHSNAHSHGCVSRLR
jgi:hypothetical protein